MAHPSSDITDFRNSDALISHDIERPMLVDEIGDTELYIGYSQNTSAKNKNNWRIKRIWKVGSVWNFGFSWDLRDTYTYLA